MFKKANILVENWNNLGYRVAESDGYKIVLENAKNEVIYMQFPRDSSEKMNCYKEIGRSYNVLNNSLTPMTDAEIKASLEDYDNFCINNNINNIYK